MRQALTNTARGRTGGLRSLVPHGLALVTWLLTGAFCRAEDSVSYPGLPEPVASFGAATADGALYVYGGHRGARHEYSAEDVSSSFHRLTLGGGGKWEKLPDGPRLQGAPLVAFAGALYRAGGMAAQNARGEAHNLHSSDSAARFKPTPTRVASPAPPSIGPFEPRWGRRGPHVVPGRGLAIARRHECGDLAYPPVRAGSGPAGSGVARAASAVSPVAAWRWRAWRLDSIAWAGWTRQERRRAPSMSSTPSLNPGAWVRLSRRER